MANLFQLVSKNQKEVVERSQCFTPVVPNRSDAAPWGAADNFQRNLNMQIFKWFLKSSILLRKSVQGCQVFLAKSTITGNVIAVPQNMKYVFTVIYEKSENRCFNQGLDRRYQTLYNTTHKNYTDNLLIGYVNTKIT